MSTPSYAKAQHRKNSKWHVLFDDMWRTKCGKEVTGRWARETEFSDRFDMCQVCTGGELCFQCNGWKYSPRITTYWQGNTPHKKPCESDFHGRDQIYYMIGEAPARDESRKDLHLSFAAKAFGKRRDDVDFLLDIFENYPLINNFLKFTTHVNLLQRWPGAGRGKGSKFPWVPAKEAAEIFYDWEYDSFLKHFERSVPWELNWKGKPFNPRPDLVMFAGRRVAKAFEVDPRTDYFKIIQTTYFKAMIVPHPSGVNQWWNGQRNQIFAQGLMSRLGRKSMVCY